MAKTKRRLPWGAIRDATQQFLLLHAEFTAAELRAYLVKTLDPPTLYPDAGAIEQAINRSELVRIGPGRYRSLICEA